jgi:sugar lactone lactonase YvrE
VRAERITDVVSYHGEGAFWHDGWGGLRFVDMLDGAVLALGPGGSVTRLAVGDPVAAMIRPAIGGSVVALGRSFSVRDDDFGELWRSEPVTALDERFNEGAVTPEGDLLCGTMRADAAPGSATLWRLRRDRTIERLLDGVTISNGIGFTRAGDRMLYVDTPTNRIDVFDWDGDPHDRRPFVEIPEDAGSPDGLCMDADDGVWVALHGGAAVRHYDRDGRLSNVIEVGARQVTSCTLGGADGRTLFITTSRENLSPEDDPNAGSLFAAEVAATAPPVRIADIRR